MQPPSCSVVRVAPARRRGFAGAGPAAVTLTASPFPLRGGRPPGPGGAEGRACGSPAVVGAGGGVGGPPPCLPPGLCGGGGGELGGAWQSWPRGPAIGQGVAPFSRPPLSRAGFSRRPSPGPLISRPLSRGAGRPGVAVRVSGQWLAGCGAAGSPPRSLSPHSLPREVARPRTSCHTVGGAWVGGPSPPPPPKSPVPAVWAFTCAAACVGAGAAAAAGCAAGSASGRGRYARPGGASCWRPHP